MFPKGKRLSRASFPLVAAGQRRAVTPHFSFSASREGQGYAVVVSKKVAKSSVARHRLKRRVLARLKDASLSPSLIVYARAGAPALTPAELSAEIAAGLAKIA